MADPFTAAGFNPYAPAMQANDAAAQRRQMMAERLMQGPGMAAPTGSNVMPLSSGGGGDVGGGGGFSVPPELAKMAGNALHDWLNPPAASPWGGAGGNFDANGMALGGTAGGGFGGAGGSFLGSGGMFGGGGMG